MDCLTVYGMENIFIFTFMTAQFVIEDIKQRETQGLRVNEEKTWKWLL